MDKIKTNRVMIVDDHPVVRAGMSQFVRGADGLDICGEAGTFEEAMAVVDQVRPDLLITDLSLPDKSGVELIREIKANGHEDIATLVVSMHDESLHALRALNAGADGYVMKESASTMLVEAIWKVLSGDIYLSPSMANRFASSIRNSAGHEDQGTLVDYLDNTMIDLFRMIGQGKTIMGIAGQLRISVVEVENLLTKVQSKLELKDHSALVRSAVNWVADQQVRDNRTLFKAYLREVPNHSSASQSDLPLNHTH